MTFIPHSYQMALSLAYEETSQLLKECSVSHAKGTATISEAALCPPHETRKSTYINHSPGACWPLTRYLLTKKLSPKPWWSIFDQHTYIVQGNSLQEPEKGCQTLTGCIWPLPQRRYCIREEPRALKKSHWEQNSIPGRRAQYDRLCPFAVHED